MYGTSFSSGNVQDDLYCPASSLLCFVMCIRAGKLAVYLAQKLLSHGTLHKCQMDDVRSAGSMAVPAAQGLQHLPSLQAGTAHSVQGNLVAIAVKHVTFSSVSDFSAMSSR